MPPLHWFKGINFNTLENLFFIVNSHHACFGALDDCFRAGNPEVVHADVDRIETLLESIEFRLRVIDGPSTPKSSAIRGSSTKPEATPYTTPAPPSKLDRPKPTAPPGGNRPSYPPSCPKWDDVTYLAKADKVCCACSWFQAQINKLGTEYGTVNTS